MKQFKIIGVFHIFHRVIVCQFQKIETVICRLNVLRQFAKVVFYTDLTGVICSFSLKQLKLSPNANGLVAASRELFGRLAPLANTVIFPRSLVSTTSRLS